MGDGTEPSASGLTNLLRLLGTALCMSGEATSRVAAHLDDVAKAYGVSGVRFFVLPTGVFVRITQHGVTAIDFAPASGGTLRLDQISAVYDLLATVKDSGSPHQPAPEEAARQIGKIFEAPSRRSPLATVLGHMILVTGLGMITNPEPKALLCYAALGLLVGVLKLAASVFSILTEALPAVAALLVTVVAVVLAAQLHVAEANRLIIPALVTLLPGTALTIGSMELAAGEMIAGTSRLVYGLNVLLLLAFGMLVGNHVIGAPATEAAGAPLGAWSPWVGVVLVGLGFFLHFSAPARSLPWLLLVLFAVWGAQATGTALAGGLAGAFLGGLVVTPAAYFAQSQRGGPPAQVTFLPSFWMLVPGALGLTGVSQLVLLGSKASLNDVTQALLTIVAISLGMMVGASLLQTAAKPSSWLDAPPPIRSPVVTSPPALTAPVNGAARHATRIRPDAAYRRLVSQASRARRRAR
ncbi:MAG TPA: threonine/serine exporter family protein [Streptosporangiaceae bacterium]|nr:threonine/serine exporter family protein [Streptosporangiaceae bacterium]